MLGMFDDHLELLVNKSSISMVIIKSIICTSHAGELEEREESDSADDEESKVFHRDGEHDLHGFANFLFHGVSPFENWFDFSVFASIIYHSTLPFNVS